MNKQKHVAHVFHYTIEVTDLSAATVEKILNRTVFVLWQTELQNRSSTKKCIKMKRNHLLIRGVTMN